MIGHLFKMVWNRKRWNALILLEIFLSFLVLFAVAATGLTLYHHQRAPLGFDYEDVWCVFLSYPSGAMDEGNAEQTLTTARQIDAYFQNRPEILAHALLNTPPYINSNWTETFKMDGRKVRSNLTLTTMGARDALDLNLVEGRWFDDRDQGEDVNPAPLVVNGRLARDLFPGEASVAGKVFINDEDEYKIIGVVDHFRKEGELRKPRNFGFLPVDLKYKVFWLPEWAMLEMAPGAGLAFQEQLVRDLGRIAPGWSPQIDTLSNRRDLYLRNETRGVKIASLIAFFMLVMVAMGLIGVLWQHVTRRTVELGVRRAKGATRKRIYLQITGEFVAVATLALGLGLIAVLQIPVLGLFTHATTGVLTTAFVVAAVIIYLLTAIASLYPGWLATRVSPAEALHYE